MLLHILIYVDVSAFFGLTFGIMCYKKKGGIGEITKAKIDVFLKKKNTLLTPTGYFFEERHFRLFSQNCWYTFFLQILDKSDLVSKFSSHGNDLSMIDVLFWEDKNILYVCLFTKKRIFRKKF